MSIKVVAVCEDHVIDQYILKPIITAMLSSMGKPSAHVTVISNARARGRGFESLLKGLFVMKRGRTHFRG
jgi:hypothetical protein